MPLVITNSTRYTLYSAKILNLCNFFGSDNTSIFGKLVRFSKNLKSRIVFNNIYFKMNPRMYSNISNWGPITPVLLKCTLCSLYILLFVITSPVFIVRQIVKYLALFLRPDLYEILDPQSSNLANDLFSCQPPRSNVVVKFVLQGRLLTNDVKKHALQHWIYAQNPTTKQLMFLKFQQYPVRWLGFTFWKHGETSFSIDNHITCVSKNTVLPE